MPPSQFDDTGAASQQDDLIKTENTMLPARIAAAPVRTPIALFAAAFALLLSLVANAQYPQATPLGCASVLLCVLVAGLLIWKQIASGTRFRTAILCVACAAACLSRSAWTSVFAIAILCAAAAIWGTPTIRPVMRGMLVACVLLAGLSLLDATGVWWQELSRLSWNGSSRLAHLFNEERQFGPWQWGLTWIAPAWCVWAAQLNLASNKSLFQPRLLLSLILGTIFTLATEQLMFALALTVLVAGVGEWRPSVEKANGRRRIAAGFALLLFAPFGLAAYCWEASVPPAPRTLTIVDGGLKTLRLPPATDVKDVNDATFGGLLALMPAYGWQCTVLPANFAPDSIAKPGVLCFINPQIYLSPAQLRAVESYVRAGGSLLVLGDHTDIGGIRGPLNQLLAFTSIRFNYDSAIPTDEGWKWKGALRAGLHPAVWGQHNDGIGISVGASLTCGNAARVLVVGDQCFSDRGNSSFGVSHLGNESYDPGEALGGLPLAAEERVGRGVVQVWGDTSGFQDQILTRTHATIARVFESLRLRRPYAMPRAVVAMAFLIAVSCGAWLLEVRPGLLFTSFAGALASFALCGACTTALTPLQLGMAATLDMSHAPLYPNTASDMGEYRLNETFLRSGSILLSTDNFDPPRQGNAWWVITAPTRPYTEAEATRLHAYVQQGGRLLLVAGGPHRAALQSVLRVFGLDIASNPYGAAHNSRLLPPDWRSQLFGSTHIAISGSNPTTSSYDAEINFQESYPIVAHTARPLVVCWGRTIAVDQPCGRGRVVIIGDSRFCTDKNLGSKKINAVNVKFLLKCLEP